VLIEVAVHALDRTVFKSKPLGNLRRSASINRSGVEGIALLPASAFLALNLSRRASNHANRGHARFTQLIPHALPVSPQCIVINPA
jgi:hypothetical protein